MSITLLLKSTNRAIKDDTNAFLKWERNEINTKKCLELFKENNDIPYGYAIDEKKFELWLNSLGYRRVVKEWTM